MPEGREIRFRVLGKPVPQGSKNVYGGRLVDVNAAKLKAWRSIIADGARQVMSTEPAFGLGEPITARLVFALSRPASYPNRLVPHVKPDLDKLVRAAFDALTDSRIINDDAQIVGLLAVKAYCEPGQYPGLLVTLRAWTGGQ